MKWEWAPAGAERRAGFKAVAMGNVFLSCLKENACQRKIKRKRRGGAPRERYEQGGRIERDMSTGRVERYERGGVESDMSVGRVERDMSRGGA